MPRVHKKNNKECVAYSGFRDPAVINHVCTCPPTIQHESGCHWFKHEFNHDAVGRDKVTCSKPCTCSRQGKCLCIEGGNPTHIKCRKQTRCCCHPADSKCPCVDCPSYFVAPNPAPTPPTGEKPYEVEECETCPRGSHFIDSIHPVPHAHQEKQDWEASPREPKVEDWMGSLYDLLLHHNAKQENYYFGKHLDKIVIQVQQAIASAKEEEARKWAKAMVDDRHRETEFARLEVISAVEEWGKRNLNDPMEHDALITFLASLKTNSNFSERLSILLLNNAIAP